MPSSALLAIGERLRTARERLGLTLDQLAEQAGLSKAHLSRLESGERQPSISALLELANALGTRVATLLGEDVDGAPLSLHRADEPRHDANGLAIGSCSGYAGSRAIEALRIIVAPGRAASAPVSHRGEEWIHVLSGTLELEHDGELHQLTPGMSAHFDATRGHRMSASAAPADVVLVAVEQATDLRTLHR